MSVQRPSFVVIVARHQRTGRYAALLHAERGGWEFPAGTVEPWEQAHQAAFRELHEETGLVGQNAWPLGPVRAPGGREGIAVVVPSWTGRLRSSEEGLVAWVSAARLVSPRATFRRTNEQILRMYREEARR